MSLDFLPESLWMTCFFAVFASIVLYRYLIDNHDFWRNARIPYVKPWPIFGSSLDVLRKPFHEVLLERYNKVGTVHGYFEKYTPVLSVGDPSLLKVIMVKDFQSFHDRSVSGHAANKVCSKMLTSLTGSDWKRVRSIVTPAFSTGKIKRMLGVFKECSALLVENFRISSLEKRPVNVKCFFEAFTMDVIASSAFSVKIDSHNDPDNEFVKTARNVFTPQFNARIFILSFFPRLRKIFQYFSSNPNPVGPTGLNFFSEVTLDIIKERKRTGQTPNDFLQMLLDIASELPKASKQDEVNDTDPNYAESQDGHQIFKNIDFKTLSMDELVSQCVVFFLAGYHTTASTLCFATYLLALNPDVQENLRQEVDGLLKDNNGELTYDLLQSMKYLDNVISETLRLFPPAPRLDRVSEKSLYLGPKRIPVLEGMSVSVPIYAIHRDATFYPNPDSFDPDRFRPEERAKRPAYTYLPFGAGPRSCIGMRFALLQIKTCLVYVITNFKLAKSHMTEVPLQFHIGAATLLRPKDMFVDLEYRKNSSSTT